MFVVYLKTGQNRKYKCNLLTNYRNHNRPIDNQSITNA